MTSKLMEILQNQDEPIMATRIFPLQDEQIEFESPSFSFKKNNTLELTKKLLAEKGHNLSNSEKENSGSLTTAFSQIVLLQKRKQEDADRLKRIVCSALDSFKIEAKDVLLNPLDIDNVDFSDAILPNSKSCDIWSQEERKALQEMSKYLPEAWLQQEGREWLEAWRTPGIDRQCVINYALEALKDFAKVQDIDEKNIEPTSL